ncbi:MAG: hypothetical protein NVSMB65_11070 [Chloroflexota bacterium]
MAIMRFLVSGAGRGLRIVAGLVLIGVGLAVLRGPGGVVLALVGLVPLAAGVFDVCILAPLFGLPFVGPAVRARISSGS